MVINLCRWFGHKVGFEVVGWPYVEKGETVVKCIRRGCDRTFGELLPHGSTIQMTKLNRMLDTAGAT